MLANLPNLLPPRRISLTDDAAAILQFAADPWVDTALVTLVEVRGGAARAVGAQMAVRADGAFCGYISGGCTEAAVAAEAVASIARREDRFLKLGEGSPFFDIVLPCGGGITLSIHVNPNTTTLSAVLDRLARRQRASLVYDPARQSLAIANEQATGWSENRFIRAYRPSTQVAIFGDGGDAEALASLAATSSMAVSRLGAEPTAFDADTAIALLMHDLDREEPILLEALSSPAFYIGALGSRHTHERRQQRLVEKGLAPHLIDRIRGPIGLFGPARDSATLALSVLADIAATRAGNA